MAANETQIRIAAVDATKQAFQSVQKNVNGLSAGLKKLAAPLAAVFAGFTAVGIIKETAAYAKEIERLSQVAGIGVERFQELAFAANRVGISQEKLGDIFKDVSDKVGDFIQTGGGGMADFFENIAPQVGVTAEQFRKLNGADALQLYVSSLEKANVSQNEMTFHLEAIASDASYLLPLLQKNGKAMGLLGEEAHSLGAVLSAEAIVQAKSLSDNMDRMNAIFTSVGRVLGNLVIPHLNAVAENFLALNRVVADRGGIVETLSDFFNVMDDLKLRKVNEELEKVTRFLKMGSIERKFFTFMSEEELLAEKKRLEDAKSAFEKMVSPSKKLAIDFEANLKALRMRHQELSEAMRPVQTAEGSGRETRDKLNQITEQLTERNKELVDVYNKTRSPVDVLNDSLAQADRLYQANNISLDMYMTLLEQANEKYESSIQKTAVAKTGIQQYAEAVRNLGNQLDNVAVRSLQGLEDALIGVMMGTMSVKDAFKSMAASIISDLARILIQRSITGPIADAIFSSFGGGADGGYFGGISPRGGAAIGGPLQANSPYMVGERGPELFVPSRSGSIVPNEDMMGGSGVTVNQTINVTTGVQQTVRVEIANLMPQIAEATKAAVLDARKRGGQFASTFA
jgi:lambda family phage tail tape measure protein